MIKKIKQGAIEIVYFMHQMGIPLRSMPTGDDFVGQEIE